MTMPYPLHEHVESMCVQKRTQLFTHTIDTIKHTKPML